MTAPRPRLDEADDQLDDLDRLIEGAEPPAPASRPPGYWLQLAAFSLLGVLLVVGAGVALLVASGALGTRLPPPVAAPAGSFPPGFAYADADGIWALSADGRLRARLVAGQRNSVLKGAAWRPGTDQIAFSQTVPFQRGGDNGTDIRVVTWDGTGDRVLVAHEAPDHHFEWPAWSADGRYLYLAHSYPLTENGRFRGETADVERLDLQTGERRRLVAGATQPSISADGRRLAFLKVFPSGTVQLWLADGDGEGAAPVLVGYQEFPYYHSPRIAPDGHAIALSATGGIGPRRTAINPPGLLAWLRTLEPPAAEAHGGGPWEVFLVDLATGEPRRLTAASSQADELSLAWSPDSRQLVYLTRGALGTIDLATDTGTLLDQSVGLGDITWPRP